MPKFGPMKRDDLVRYLRKVGFRGPYAGSKHQFMVKSNLKLALPNPHSDDIGRALLGEY